MNINPFQNKKKEEQHRLAIEQWAKKERVIDTFVEKELISYQPQFHRFFIASVLANVYLDKPERWKAFMENLQLWAIYKRRKEEWEQLFLQRELAAVREAKKQTPTLTPSEIQRIRQEARWKVDITELEDPKIEPFDFYIADIESRDATAPNILVVGHYDGKKMEMAVYEEIKRHSDQ